MKVLFTTTPGWGHVHPMVPLASAFVARGDEVAWAAATEVCDRLTNEGFATFAAGQSEAENRSAFRSKYPELNDLRPQERPLFMFPRLFGLVEAPPQLADPQYRVAATAVKEEMAVMPGPDAVAEILAQRDGQALGDAQ